MIYCTVTSNQYLFLAKVMVNSLKRTNPGARVILCLVEEDYSYAAPFLRHFDHVILAKELGIANFYQHMFKHNAYEASGSCKARLMLYALNIFLNEDKFVFLDTDMKVFGPFNEIMEELNQQSIILSPHITKPAFKENSILKAGIFNTGFFAIKRSPESYHFLNWWSDRIEKGCYCEPENGMFLEQKWLDHAPVFFNINILRHPGYNVAGWNLSQRKIKRSIHDDFKVNGMPLKLFHFSGILKHGKNYANFLNEFLNKKPHSNLDPSVRKIINQYITELTRSGMDFSKTVPWSYNYYASGKPIEMAARLAFRQNPQMYTHIANPFLMTNSTFIQGPA